MTCKDLIEFLSDYLAGEIPPDQRAHFEKHLAACGACRNYLDSFRRTVAAGKACASGDCSDIPEDLVQAILSACRGARR